MTIISKTYFPFIEDSSSLVPIIRQTGGDSSTESNDGNGEGGGDPSQENVEEQEPVDDSEGGFMGIFSSDNAGQFLFGVAAILILAVVLYRLRRFLNLSRRRGSSPSQGNGDYISANAHHVNVTGVTQGYRGARQGGVTIEQLNEVAPLAVYEGKKKEAKAEDKSGKDEEQEEEEDGVCAICLDELEKGMRVRELKCGHIYHGSCIEKWVVHKNNCPSCTRKVVGMDESDEGQEGNEEVEEVERQEIVENEEENAGREASDRQVRSSNGRRRRIRRRRGRRRRGANGNRMVVVDLDSTPNEITTEPVTAASR